MFKQSLWIRNWYVSICKCHFFCFTETWGKYKSLRYLTVNGFNLCTSYSCCSKVGGVVIYAKTGISTKAVGHTEHCVEKIVELCAISFKMKHQSAFTINWYKSPRAGFRVFLEILNAPRWF